MSSPVPKPNAASERRFQILVCDGPSCGVMHESERLVDCLRAAIGSDPDLARRVGVASFTCYGRCDDGPNMFVRECGPGEDPRDGNEPDIDVFEQQRGFYPGMDEAKVIRVLEGHCGAGEVVEDLVDDY